MRNISDQITEGNPRAQSVGDPRIDNTPRFEQMANCKGQSKLPRLAYLGTSAFHRVPTLIRDRVETVPTWDMEPRLSPFAITAMPKLYFLTKRTAFILRAKALMNNLHLAVQFFSSDHGGGHHAYGITHSRTAGGHGPLPAHA